MKSKELIIREAIEQAKQEIEDSKTHIYLMELDERYLQRKLIEGKNKHEVQMILGQKQTQIKYMKEDFPKEKEAYIKFLEEVLEEVKKENGKTI